MCERRRPPAQEVDCHIGGQYVSTCEMLKTRSGVRRTTEIQTDPDQASPSVRLRVSEQVLNAHRRILPLYVRYLMASTTLAEGLALALRTPSTALSRGYARAQVAAQTLHEAHRLS